jgi:hypothetical protein
MTELELLYLSYNPTDDTIDFGVKTSEAVDRILRNHAKDVSARMRDLADRLDRGEYPFGRVSMVIQHCQGDPEDRRESF